MTEYVNGIPLGRLSRRYDLTGKKFTRLTVLGRSPQPHGYGNGRVWECRCDCGNTVYANTYCLLHGKVKSCGCYDNDAMAKHDTTHGESKTRLYHIWKSMKRRCSSKKYDHYDRYGGRGIIVCKEWKQSYVSFRDWAKSNGYAENLTIDRINNDGNYEPQNCRWVTQKQQERNRRDTVYVPLDGKQVPLAEAAERLGVNLKLAWERNHRGKPIAPKISEN